MPKKQSPYGVSRVQLGLKDLTVTVPALNATEIIGSSTAATVNRPGTVRPKLTAGDYNFWVALMGYDDVNGGYSLARSTATPEDPVTVDSGDFLELYLASPLPSNMGKAIAAAVFLQAGSEDPKMVDWAYIDASREFSWLVTTLGGDNANSIPEATLVGTGETEITGTRTPKGVDWGARLSTTGGVRFRHPKETFTEEPDDSQDFPVAIGSATNVEFSLRGRDLVNLCRSLGYDYVKFTNTASKVIEQASGDLYDIVSQLVGNGAIKVTRPRAGVGGRLETRLFLGNVHANISEVVEDEQKKQSARLDYVLTAANLDYLLDGMCNQIIYSNG